MILIHDEYNESYYWALPDNQDYELSPTFDAESDARAWLAQIKQLLTQSGK